MAGSDAPPAAELSSAIKTADESDVGSITPNISDILGDVQERETTSPQISKLPLSAISSTALPFPDASHRRNSKVVSEWVCPSGCNKRVGGIANLRYQA